ncbi:MAG: hypothetical protein B7Y08_19435, partial [Rhodospirillales bacterium 24-66-33]
MKVVRRLLLVLLLFPSLALAQAPATTEAAPPAAAAPAGTEPAPTTAPADPALPAGPAVAPPAGPPAAAPAQAILPKDLSVWGMFM